MYVQVIQYIGTADDEIETTGDTRIKTDNLMESTGKKTHLGVEVTDDGSCGDGALVPPGLVCTQCTSQRRARYVCTDVHKDRWRQIIFTTTLYRCPGGHKAKRTKN